MVRRGRAFTRIAVLTLAATSCVDFDGFVSDAVDGGHATDGSLRDARSGDAPRQDSPAADRDGAAMNGDGAGGDALRPDAHETGGGTDAKRCATLSCSAPADCASLESPCASVSCVSSCCVVNDSAPETSCEGDQVCDGMGRCVACVAKRDCPASLTACEDVTCTMNTCGATPAAINTACTDNSGHVCNGSGACVMCTASDSSACSALQTCMSGQCVGL